MSDLSDKALEAAKELKTTDPYDKTEGRIEKTLRECAEALDAKDNKYNVLYKKAQHLNDCRFCKIKCDDEVCQKDKKCAELEKELQKYKEIVDEQANDEGLWFNAQTAPEAYLQSKLRGLHAAIEGESE